MALLAAYPQGTNPFARHGFVLEPPAAPGDPFTVTVPFFDSSGSHVFEITYWMPRGEEIPAEGDRVLMLIDDEEQAWVVAWSPS